MWFKQGQIKVNGGIGSEFGGDECGNESGDSHAEKINPTPFLSPPLHPINNTLPNQSKPIVPTPSLSLL